MGNSNTRLVDPDNLQLDHFELLQVIGRGAFGKVRIVRNKTTNGKYALKYISKKHVVATESIRNIIRERQMLEKLNHPLLCNLRFCFQDIEHLYIVCDLMQGGDLRFHISRKAFTEEAVRFWIAEVACAVKYIHSKNVVHRDIKPDNILLDKYGHVHLADFNVASQLRPEDKLTSRSGTYAYLAPEVLRSQPYRFAVDWWSLGVMFYECVYGRRPFNEVRNLETLISQICDEEVAFPVTKPPVSLPCLNAIRALLTKSPSDRLGATSFDDFCKHQFFRGLDFDKLNQKEVDPVFVPSSEKTNFDASYDLEELLLEDVPLEVRARKQKPREELRSNATEEEHRAEGMYKYLESRFANFDYTKLNTPASELSSLSVSPAVAGLQAGSPSSPAAAATPPPVEMPNQMGPVEPERTFARSPAGGNVGQAVSTSYGTGGAAVVSPQVFDPSSVSRLQNSNAGGSMRKDRSGSVGSDGPEEGGSTLFGGLFQRKKKVLEAGVLSRPRTIIG